MTKVEADLIGEAIDFYNLNHFKGKETIKELVKLKKRIKALTIPIVSNHRELLIGFEALNFGGLTKFNKKAITRRVDKYLDNL